MALALCLAAPIGGVAQGVEAAGAEAEPPSDSLFMGVSPRGAMIRSLVVPGWGHAAIRSNRRGAFYLAVDAGIGMMLWKTGSRISAAREIVSIREDAVRERLAGEGVTDPAEIEAALATDEAAEEARGLVSSREDQREDWMALGIFFVFFGGVDAYVSAHLADFPVPLTLGPGGGGGLELAVRLPVR